jgi:hypothetical protein
VLSNFEDAPHGRKVWQMPGAVTMRREHLVARFDARRAATLDDLVPLVYARPAEGLPAHVRAASALRRFDNRLVIVQDDVNALAVRSRYGSVRSVPLPAHASGVRAFDDTLGNKHEKLDLEACVTLPDGRLVAFGSGSLPTRERLVVWNGREPPVVVAEPSFYDALRAAVTQGESRLNIEGAVVRGDKLELFQRGNDTRGAGAASLNAIAEVDLREFAEWLADRAPSPPVVCVTTVELGADRGVPFGFTDAVALDGERVVVLACAEDSACAISDGAVLGCRVGMLDEHGVRLVDVHDAAGQRTRLKLEGIERRRESSTEFDVVVDVDRPSVPAQLGRLVWEWR